MEAERSSALTAAIPGAGDFERLVEDALQHLHDLAVLRHHPLASPLIDPAHPAPGQALHHLLVHAIEAVVTGAPTTGRLARTMQYLRLRYLEGLEAAQVARRLGITDRQGRRDRQTGVRTVASFLWEHYRQRSHLPQLPAVAGQIAALEAEVQRLKGASPKDSVDLPEVLTAAVRTTAALAAARGVTVRVCPIPGMVPPVAANRTVLRQIVIALLAAAIDYAPGSTLTITLRAQPETVILDLHLQHARTLPDPATCHLFTAVQRLAALEGSRCHWQALDPRTLAITYTAPVAQTVTVLLVDDNPDFGALLRRLLGGAYRVVQATTAAEALQALAVVPPDVIVLDLLLPGVDGWELFEQLRGSAAGTPPPIVVCSVLQEETLALSLGATAFVAKPVDPAHLIRAIERCAGRRSPPPSAEPAASGARAAEEDRPRR
jgi:CheY-like chemotaxis protein